MSKKYFSRQKDVDTSDGLRTLTIVGRLEKKTYNDNNGIARKKRVLTYAYSIKHPDDMNDEQRGIELAKRRLDVNPLGVLESKLTTCLNVDQINAMLDYELNYIETNLAKFIDKI